MEKISINIYLYFININKIEIPKCLFKIYFYDKIK